MTEPQHMTALATANAIRKARSALRQQVHGASSFEGSCAELGEILAAGPPSCMSSMRLEETLRWLFHHGKSINRVINDVLDLAGCSEWKLVGELSVRQRSIVVNVLREWSCERRAAA